MILQYLAFAADVAVAATLPSLSYTTEAISPANATAGVIIGADGNFYAIDTTTAPLSSVRFAWKTGAGLAADYQVRCDVVSDPNSLIAGGLFDNDEFNSSVGTWLSCATERKWGAYRQTDTVGQNTAIITLTIRSAADTRTLATGTYTLTAKVV